MSDVPKGLEVIEGDGLRITMRWRDRAALFGIVFGLALVAGVVMLTTLVVDPPAGADPGIIPILIAMSAYFGVCAFIALYWTIAKLVNRTEVAYVGGELRVLRGPVPFPSVRILRGEIRELRGVKAAIVNGVPTSHVVATLTDGRTKRLLWWVRVPWADYIVERFREA